MTAAEPADSSGSSVAPPVVKRRRGRGGVYAAIGVIVVVAILVGVGLSTSWYGLESSSTSGCTGVTLQGNGAQFVNPLLTVWTSAYATQSGNKVNYVDGGSGTGLTDFSEHPPLIDFAMTDDPLTPAELSAMPAQPLTLPFVGGALAIIYNLPGVTGHLNLNGTVLADIYQGNITTWNNSLILAAQSSSVQAELNALSSETILTVHRSDAAGTTYVLSDFLSQASPYWASHVGKGISISFPSAPKQTAEKGNSLMISTVAANPESIGYSDLTDVLTAASPPQYAAIQNPAGNYIVPTIADTASAIANKVASLASIPNSTDTKDWYNVSMVNAKGTSDYPLETFVYLFVYQATDKGFTPTLSKSRVLVQWLDYVLSPAAQALANETQPSPLYYTALPASVIAVDQAGIQTMTFNGAAIPACT